MSRTFVVEGESLLPPADFAEETLWSLARNGNNDVAYRLYLQRYPQGKYADEARADQGISFGGPPRKMEDQGLFLKANSALIGPSEGVPTSAPISSSMSKRRLGRKAGRSWSGDFN